MHCRNRRCEYAWTANLPRGQLMHHPAAYGRGTDALEEKQTTHGDPFQQRLETSTPKPVAPALQYESANGTTFLRPESLAELLAMKAEHGAKAELVAGATEIGFASTSSTAVIRCWYRLKA